VTHVQRLPQSEAGGLAGLDGPVATVSRLTSARCALCGASLVGDPLPFHMVSPLVSMGHVTVCRGCHKAALSEGYRPAD
jgi:hypothetical protein